MDINNIPEIIVSHCKLYGIVDLSSICLVVSITAKGKIFAVESPAYKDELSINDVFQAPVQIDLSSLLAELK